MRLILFIFSALLVFGCKSTKKPSRTSTTMVKPKKKRTSTTRKGTGKVDTIQWTEIDKSKDYYDAIENLDLEKRSSYDVSLFLPLGLAKEDMGSSSSPDSKVGIMTQYYAGVLMAMDVLSDEGIALNLSVFDAESGSFENKLQKCKSSDVIIGPQNIDQLAVAANFGKNNEIPVISPWKSSTKIAKENPYYVQLIPGQTAHYDKIVEDALSNYKRENIYLLGRNQSLDKKYMNYMQRVGAGIAKTGNKKPFKEFIINEDSLRIGETAFDSIFYDQELSVFILPHWSFERDNEFVYNTVRKMSGERGFEKVVFYGMPILMDSERIGFEYYRNLNMRICKASYVDKKSPDALNFRKKYYNLYNDLPSGKAYEGFDMMMLVGRHIYNYGKKFQYYMEDYSQNLIQTQFDIQKVFGKNGDDQFKDIQYFQNKHLYILSFENNHFVAR